MRNYFFVFLFLLVTLNASGESDGLTVKLSSSSSSICSGGAAVLTASVSGGAAPYTYIWNTGEVTSSISVNKGGTYKVIVSDSAPGSTPVTEEITIATNATPNAPTVANTIICPNSTATLTASAPGGLYQWYDAPVGGNLLASGSTYTTKPLTIATTFYVETTLNGCTSARTSVTVYLYGKPSVTNATICQGSSAVLSASGGDTYSWYASASGGKVLSTSAQFTTPVLMYPTTYYVVAVINGCASLPTPVNAYVSTAPLAPIAPGVAICTGATASLHATSSQGVVDWFTVPEGGVSLISSPDFTSPQLTSSTTYYVQVTSPTGCISARTPVKVTVEPTLQAPVVHDFATCYGTSITLTASGSGGTLQWFNSATSTTVLASGNTFNTPALNTSTTYYVQVTNGGCFSPRSAVNITVNGPVIAPNAAGLITCSGSVTTLTATSIQSGSTFAWYDAAKGGNLLASTAVYVTPPINSTTTLYVQASLNGCISSRTAVTISILPIPTAPVTSGAPLCTDNQGITPSGVTICEGNQAMLIASGANNVTYEWFDAQTGGDFLIANSVYITPILNKTTTYYVQSTANGCNSPRIPIMVNVITQAQCATNVTTSSVGSTNVTVSATKAPTARNVSICSGNNAILTATSPGGCYEWYDATTGGNLLKTGAVYTTPVLIANTNYYVQTTLNGITSPRTPVTVSVVAAPTAPVAKEPTVCFGNSTTLIASGLPGTYAWYDKPLGGNLLSKESAFVTPYITQDTAYYVQSGLDYYYCSGPRTKVKVFVNAVPTIISASTLAICSGNVLNYTIESNIAATTFNWSRTAVAGISNAALNNQTSNTINETLINTSDTTETVTYIITPIANGCSGASLNLVVTVSPNTVVTSPAAVTICNSTSVNYKFSLNTIGTFFRWSRATVPGIKNAAITGQQSSNINEVLYNTSNAPINVTYVFTYQTTNCQVGTFNLVVTVNPESNITSPPTETVCSGTPLNYTITSNVSSSTFSWSRVAVKGISNAAIANQASNTINESLINTSASAIRVIYIITPTNNNCAGIAFSLSVIVNPQQSAPMANSNSPVCMGSGIELNTPTVINATYLWTGPAGFQSASQNPVINSVTADNAGVYNLYTIINGCSSPASSVNVVVDPPPLANAGPDQIVCLNASEVNLLGKVSGGTTTGIWTTNGSGTFFPSSNVLNAEYLPSSTDMAAGSVMLTLSSTSPDNCTISTSSMNVTFQLLTGVKAGNSQILCAQTYAVKLDGQVFAPGGGLWKSSGTGTFSPSASDLNASYIPDATDLKNGKVTLTLHAVNAGECYTSEDSLTITFLPPPTVNAGGIRYVLRGNAIVLTPTVSDNKVQYQWSPDVNINNTTIKNPTITGDENITYTLTVTDSLGCVTRDQTNIVVSPELVVPNTFTPNGDGINDLWEVKGLIAYQNAVIDVFDRYGQKVFHSVGYGSSWDGSCNGRIIPPGTYYYVIDLKVNGQVLSGSLALVK
ncbi:gliding motility-associated-like protein [Mucilaginibacter frigoritolerans]|uniref:Gliding motility-associated-like protein n=1 Tax=Mucilaginibacter frigoritolerans TaxID=652788 RepID=A0A562TS43_9SPHI|nr:PKD-like domain-containing protein [Mucilaginibacter frigoritolerans]TWI96362.1 gliding motility-associated-like protein [Mucilaginibacter frigoritolerans]